MRGFDLGDNPATALRLGKIDQLTGLRVHHGIVGLTRNHKVKITESIGGDDVSDYVRFSLKSQQTLKIKTTGAIAQLLSSQRTVIVDSSDGYESTLQVTLQPGRYYLGFSSEGSIPYDFTSVISFLTPTVTDIV